MGEVKVKLSDETEAIFRKRAMEAFGYGRGSISEAVEEAVKGWVAGRPNTTEAAESLNKLRGVLKHVNKTSVELQHEISKIRGSRYARRR